VVSLEIVTVDVGSVLVNRFVVVLLALIVVARLCVPLVLTIPERMSVVVEVIVVIGNVV
jgi:hypothetical protein